MKVCSVYNKNIDAIYMYYTIQLEQHLLITMLIDYQFFLICLEYLLSYTVERIMIIFLLIV